MNEDGTWFYFHGIGKAQGKPRKSYSPFVAWEESCVT